MGELEDVGDGFVGFEDMEGDVKGFLELVGVRGGLGEGIMGGWGGGK